MEIFIVTYSYQCYEMGVDKSEHCEEFVVSTLLVGSAEILQWVWRL